MRKEYKSEDAKRRVQAHQFGQPNGNRRGDPSTAAQTREFYRWVENVATVEDLKSYLADDSKPAVRRQFIKCLLHCEKVQDFFDLTNQTHGYPKQEISMDAPPEIVIEWDVD